MSGRGSVLPQPWDNNCSAAPSMCPGLLLPAWVKARPGAPCQRPRAVARSAVGVAANAGGGNHTQRSGGALCAAWGANSAPPGAEVAVAHGTWVLHPVPISPRSPPRPLPRPRCPSGRWRGRSLTPVNDSPPGASRCQRRRWANSGPGLRARGRRGGTGGEPRSGGHGEHSPCAGATLGEVSVPQGRSTGG